jgi:hypothetical protein
MPRERDATITGSLPEPSCYAGTTQEMRRVGGDVLLEELQQYGLSVGHYSAASIAAKIFTIMWQERERLSR